MALDTGQTNASSSAPSGSSKAASFTYPPLFSFPPFFTIQPHPATQSTQLAQWTQLVLKWCAANRVFYLDAARDDPISLWRNSRIQRALGGEGRRTLLTHMVAEENAAWESGAVASAPKSSGGGGSSRLGGSSKANAGLSSSTTTTSKALIYWRKPQEWGDLIYQWVSLHAMWPPSWMTERCMLTPVLSFPSQ